MPIDVCPILSYMLSFIKLSPFRKLYCFIKFSTCKVTNIISNIINTTITFNNFYSSQFKIQHCCSILHHSALSQMRNSRQSYGWQTALLRKIGHHTRRRQCHTRGGLQPSQDGLLRRPAKRKSPGNGLTRPW